MAERSSHHAQPSDREAAAHDARREAPPRRDTPSCDVCGSPDTEWIRCKLVCRACRSIIMSCGDL